MCLGENAVNVFTVSNSGKFNDVMLNKNSNSIVAYPNSVSVREAL